MMTPALPSTRARSACILPLLALAACTPTQSGPTPAGPPVAAAPASRPVDVAGLVAGFEAEGPAVRAINLLTATGKGFRFFTRDRVDYVAFGSTSDLVTPTRILSIAGNRLCLAQSGGWSGACLDVFEAEAAGTYRVSVTFGNGASRPNLLMALTVDRS